jgi:hypothetical protein
MAVKLCLAAGTSMACSIATSRLRSSALPVPAISIEGRAVIDGGADNWQADRDIYSGLDAEHLHWTVPLVVIHGYYDVKVAAPGAKEKRIGGQRPCNVPASGPTGLDSRFDLRFFLAVPE